MRGRRRTRTDILLIRNLFLRPRSCTRKDRNLDILYSHLLVLVLLLGGAEVGKVAGRRRIVALMHGNTVQVAGGNRRRG